MAGVHHFISRKNKFVKINRPATCRRRKEFFRLSSMLNMSHRVYFSLGASGCGRLSTGRFVLRSVRNGVSFNRKADHICTRNGGCRVLTVSKRCDRVIIGRCKGKRDMCFTNLPCSPRGYEVLLHTVCCTTNVRGRVGRCCMAGISARMAMFPGDGGVTIVGGSSRTQRASMCVGNGYMCRLSLRPNRVH